MIDNIKITFNDSTTEEFSKGITVQEVADFYQTKMINPIIGATINNQVVEMNTKLNSDTVLTFFDINDINGHKIYQAGLKFVMTVALKDLYPTNGRVVFGHSIDKGIMCEISNGKPLDEEMCEKLKEKMNEIITSNLPIEKLRVSKKEAINYYNSIGENEKAINIQNSSTIYVTLYKLKNSYNYFYTDMPSNTGVLSKFDLIFLKEGEAVLMFPSPRSANEVPNYKHNEKVVEAFDVAKEWVRTIDVEYVSHFNKIVTERKISEFIRMNELFFSNSIYDMVKDALTNENLKMILIAGPSSSGKTTSTKRIKSYLKSMGKKVLMISVDDYFKDRGDTPKKDNGEYDFESVLAIEVDLFNSHLEKLINGEGVKLPTYDFIAGKKYYPNEAVTIDSDTLLVVEGLHCLNEKLTEQIPRISKYKVYLSPFAPLNADRHNHLSTLDLRLIRRIVRDNRDRGRAVTETIKSWQSVRYGEEEYIFPHIGEADSVLNTALIYELGVLKVYAEPILYSVDINSPYYEEARRLISFLSSFFPISSEYVPRDSILREFIGGSIYEK